MLISSSLSDHIIATTHHNSKSGENQKENQNEDLTDEKWSIVLFYHDDHDDD